MNGTVTLPAQIKHLFLLMLIWTSLQQSTQWRKVRTASKTWTWRTQIPAATVSNRQTRRRDFVSYYLSISFHWGHCFLLIGIVYSTRHISSPPLSRPLEVSLQRWSLTSMDSSLPFILIWLVVGLLLDLFLSLSQASFCLFHIALTAIRPQFPDWSWASLFTVW